MPIQDLKGRIARLPEQPGVYLYFNLVSIYPVDSSGVDLGQHRGRSVAKKGRSAKR